MAELFDIAHLITAVGVDGVKIKQEPGLPEKSSNEILTELFSTFDADADDGVASPENSDAQQAPNDTNNDADKSIKHQIKKKKSKKKHKHKEKHKKKSKHNSSDSNSDVEGSKKKKKHKKKSKRRHESVSSKSSDSAHSKAKMQKLESNNLETDRTKKISDTPEKNDIVDTTKLNELDIEKKLIDAVTNDCESPLLPPISTKKVEDESYEPIISKLTEKVKQPVQGKILIKDLKNSTVYNETVKEIENKKKAKAAKMEDGELSDSSSDISTPTLSPTPPRFRSPSFSPSRDRKKSRMHSPTRSAVSAKNDLRLVLREKEKKKLGVSDCRDDVSHKDTKDKGSKRSRSCHSQDEKRSRSQTRYSSQRSRSGGREKRRDKSREKRDRDKSSERRDLGRGRERRRYRSRSEDRSKDKYTRGRSRSKERKERIEIDKKKLLEIARRNAINMIKQGTLPLAQQDKAIAAIQSGGKTVDELTDFCKTLSKSEALGELSNISSEEESEFEKGFHHPFLLKERPSSIIMNIKDAKQLPTKTFQEKAAETSNQLRLQFPVSSGQQHRKTESEWVPVIPKKPEPKKIFVPASTNGPPAIMPPPSPLQPTPITVFPTTEVVDIGSIVSQRLAAMRKLRENPNDVNALNAMHQAQNEMKTWAESKQMPGQFTGSTGAKVLTPAELSSGYQAWARKAHSYIREETTSAA
ncbi:PREDICTED: protein SON-like isoform X2 [Dinoponera quadriceps]|uniref:Protein SON-like isoform X2 n=1 Tax=Dinoponera quadriceps TaxID=609295 RepID=A0A6P3XQW8_DINQU|nr:PREDICTED: protein SON-like isoform X2 [Dinoponera quadriceps]XP_014480767.1 PREDICTED: protein SON-like isoform X2 [Dinoponera quadriceps]